MTDCPTKLYSIQHTETIGLPYTPRSRACSGETGSALRADVNASDGNGIKQGQADHIQNDHPRGPGGGLQIDPKGGGSRPGMTAMRGRGFGGKLGHWIVVNGHEGGAAVPRPLVLTQRGVAHLGRGVLAALG